MHVEKQYILKSTINCTMNPTAFKQASNMINLLLILVSEVFNFSVVSYIQTYYLNSTFILQCFSVQVPNKWGPGSKYKPINCARSLLVGPSQKRARNHWTGKEKVTLTLGLGKSERRSWQ